MSNLGNTTAITTVGTEASQGAPLGLYYPCIHFTDDEWVKLSTLYCDRMARIVPEFYQTHDSEVVRSLQDAFVVNVSADDQSDNAVASHSLNLLEADGEELVQRYAVHSQDDDVVTVDGLATGSSVLPGKMTDSLALALTTAGLAVARPDPSLASGSARAADS